MSKSDDLETLSKRALKAILAWMNTQGRVQSDKWTGWVKDECVGYLAAKLDASQVASLLRLSHKNADLDDAERDFARILGLPSKEVMLFELSQREDLVRAMEKLERQDRVAIPWRSLSKEGIADYLTRKMEREELAEFLGLLQPSRARRSSPAPSASVTRKATARATASTTIAPAISYLAGRYELRSKLGDGGFGEVYEAFDHQTGHPCVLKIAKTPDRFESLKREYTFGITVKAHPHICRYYDMDPTHRFLKMEHGGRSVQSIIVETAGALALPTALEIARQAALGLDHLHQNSVIHHDVNPGNILVDEANHVRVSDFGISVHAAAAQTTQGSETRMAVTRHAYFHPGYAAPEVRSGGFARSRSDQYELALVLASMLEGRIYSTELQERPSLPGLDSSQQQAVWRALSQFARERFQTCTEFIRALAVPTR